MDAYSWTMVGLMGFAIAWGPVVWAAWVNERQDMQTDASDTGVPLRVWMPYQPVVEDIAGSAGIAVARHTGKPVSRVLKSVYVYAARHASDAWQRPSAFVRRHGRGILSSAARYHDTLSATVRGRDWVKDTVHSYKARHTYA